MKSALRDLYDGNICPGDDSYPDCKELLRATARMNRKTTAFEKTLGEQQQMAFDDVFESIVMADAVAARENYYDGFRLGARIMLEILQK